MKTGSGHASFCGNDQPHAEHRHTIGVENPDGYKVCEGVPEPTDPRLDFNAVLHDLLATEAPLGWESYLAGDERSETAAWFASARNAAAWVTRQDPERLDTDYEYLLRPRPAPSADVVAGIEATLNYMLDSIRRGTRHV